MYTFRFATEKDFQKIKVMMLQALIESSVAFTLTYSEATNASDSWWNAYLNNFFDRKRGSMILSFNQNELVGMGGILFNSYTKKKHVGELVWIYTDVGFRQQGIAQKVLKELINLAEENKLLKLNLSVINTQTKAINLYKKNGFVVSGIMKKEIKNNDIYQDLILMEKFLA
ncbi:MAG: hypothetical protein KatS3mg085_660 [Candidatus Dojkabacteria bacterium]|nr:MAG: hypothetical protein KatS3mg085_660 [Candidatus Dojkabacteria bacterium]